MSTACCENTRHRLLQKDLTSANIAERSYIKNFEALIEKQPNLGYPDVKLVFYCMDCAGWSRRLSLCEYYYLYVSSKVS